MTFEGFLDSWYDNILPNKHKQERIGQSLMNYLGEVWSEEYYRITSINYYDRTDIDCFYNDDLIFNCLAHLKDVWKNREV